MAKSHDEESIRWTSSPEIWWNWWTKKKNGNKFKDETYNEEIDKCEENKIFKLFPGITKRKEFFIILVYFIRFISYKISYLR